MDSFNISSPIPQWDVQLPDPLNYAKTMMTSISCQVTQAFRESFLAQSQEIGNVPKDQENKETAALDKKTILTTKKTIPSKQTRSTTDNDQENVKNKKNIIVPTAHIQKNFYLLKSYQQKAKEAVEKKQVFMIYDGYHGVVNELKKRGWIEKLSDYKYRGLQDMTQDKLLMLAAPGNDYETALLSNMLVDKPPNFIWQPKGLKDSYDYMLPYRNRIRRSHELDFTTKEGIIACAENCHWNTIPNIAEVHCPRYHRLAFKEEIPEFLEDFRITSCLSLLMFIDENCEQLLNNKKGRKNLSCIYFATERVIEAINRRKSENIDDQPQFKPVESSVSSQEWAIFNTDFRNIVYEGAKFKADKTHYHWEVNKVKGTLKVARQYWPTLHMDGSQNTWILKPAYSCRGKGIRIMKDYSKIVAFAAARPQMRYIVQKYIERPLLIHKTKFDIRQYVLITINSSYNIWMYRECYLRFSSQEYNLNELTEAVHITNNSVQRKYKNGARSVELPRHNMWHSSEYETYLATIGMPSTWKKIYRGMQKNLIAIFLASLEGTDFVQNAFELFGCDFMIDQNYDPVLIEINATPDMSPSTMVTRKICQQTLSDVIKVVVDHSKDSSNPTGGFELIYKVPLQNVNTFRNSALRVDGKQLKAKTSIKLNPVKQNQSSIMRLKSSRSFLQPVKSQVSKTDSEPESELKLKDKNEKNAVGEKLEKVKRNRSSLMRLKSSRSFLESVKSQASKTVSEPQSEQKLKDKNEENVVEERLEKEIEKVIAKKFKATPVKSKLAIKRSQPLNALNIIEKSLKLMKMVNETSRKKRTKFTMGSNKKTVKIAKFKPGNVKKRTIMDIIPIDALKGGFKDAKEKAILLGFMDIICQKMIQSGV